ncbi:MAG: hypothetical protein H0U21_14805 [Acidimicrobiia bacterium]|nr:hypothetical protein [Acidimicrobiia bacterium]
MASILRLVLRPWDRGGSGDDPGPTDQPAASVTTATTTPAPAVALSIRVDVDEDAYEDGGWSMAFADEPPDPALRRDDPDSESLDWALVGGGVSVGSSHLRMTVVNRSGETIQIRDIAATVTDRGPPLDASVLRTPPAGLEPILDYDFDLDGGNTARAARIAEDGTSAPAFSDEVISLVPHESVELRLNVLTATCTCRFVFQLEAVTGATTTTFEVSDGGEPFVVTAAAADGYGAELIDAEIACNRHDIVPVGPDAAPDC